jgi:hypothetical protein
MRPAIVMPGNDPRGLLWPQLAAVAPLLAELFEQAFVSVPPATARDQQALLRQLQAGGFFRFYSHPRELPPGEDFRRLYGFAAADSEPDQVLHLTFPDRVVYALQSEHRAAFMADVRGIGVADTPLEFQRSAAAWATHPRDYRLLEQALTRAGEELFGRTLDYAWCHLALRADRLAALLPELHRPDLSLVAELAVLLRDELATREVDWLAWEDPFIYGCDPEQLRAERDQSADETRKRLGYVLPMLEVLIEAAATEAC